MDRIAHYLGVPRKSSWPDKIIVLSVDAPPRELPGGEWSEESPPGHWAGQVCERGQDGYITGDHRPIVSALPLFSWLESELIPRKTVWIFAWDMAWLLAANGFWQLLETRAWRLGARDPTAPDSLSAGSSNWTGGVCIIDDPPTIVAARPKSRSGLAKFVCARNYGLDARPQKEKGELQCMADTRTLVMFLNGLFLAGLPGLKPTAAGAAMSLWRARFMRAPVLAHAESAVLELERRSLLPGRNECWKVGNVPGPVVELDCNSFYPSFAGRALMPARLRNIGRLTLPRLTGLLKAGYVVCADVVIETSAPLVPKAGDRNIIYPCGKFKTTLIGEELALAVRAGVVKEITAAAWYDSDYLFEGWCKWVLKAKAGATDTSKSGLAGAAKRLGVALFGKFAQRSWRWTPTGSVKALEPFALWWSRLPPEAPPPPTNGVKAGDERGRDRAPAEGYCRWRSIGWSVQWEQEQGEGLESCPAITAAVYAAGRVKLWDLIQKAGAANCFYCDTDSLFVSEVGYHRLAIAGKIHPTAPGMLKRVAVHDWMVIQGLKHYVTPTKSVQAGVPLHATATGDGGYTWRTSEPLLQGLAGGHAPGECEVEKRANYAVSYHGGTVLPSGRVEPFTLYEE